MNELIKIEEYKGLKAVSARDLYYKLGYPRKQFLRWSKYYIEQNKKAVEGKDWIKLKGRLKVSLDSPTTHGRCKYVDDYVLSLDFAKRLAIMARTEVGHVIQNYFLAVEKRYNLSISTFVGRKLELPSDKFIEEL